uniref:Uncharacterized protein n=1 Tax=Globodera rostochiensis TaxID=31243 RepID=A0A914HNF5_GLORO
MNIFILFSLFCIILPLVSPKNESEQKQMAAQREGANCVDFKQQIEEVTIDGQRREVALLEGPCFSECRQKFAQGVNKSIWQRIKGIFGGGLDNEKKRTEEAKCFLQCFCH